MSFIYKEDTGVSTPPIALAITSSTHTPSPSDTMVFSRLSDLSLFVPNPALTGFGVTDGVVSCDAAYWSHVDWSANFYDELNPGSDGFTAQVVGVMVNGFVLLDGPGFPFTPPNWDNRVGFPDPPEFHLLWNPSGGPIVDFVSPSGGQAGSATWDDATKTLTIVPQTYHPPTVFGALDLDLIPAPTFVDSSPLVVPPLFGDGSQSSPEPTAFPPSLVVPPVFGGLTVTPGSPDDVPPDTEPPPEQDPYGPPEGRPSVDSGGAIPGADVTGRSGAVRVSRVRPVGGW